MTQIGFGLFIEIIGITYQYRYEDFSSPAWGSYKDSRNAITGNFSIGYLLSNKKDPVKFSIALFGTDPYSNNDPNNATVEWLTQLGNWLKGKSLATLFAM